MTSIGNSVLELLLSAVWPRFCVNCGAEGGLLCQPCDLAWEHTPPEAGEGHVAFFAYANPTVRQLICAWKYDYDLSAFKILTDQVEELLPELITEVRRFNIQGIVPLPLSAKRLRERGFNQSRMIADWLASKLGVPVLDVLERAHRSGHQAERTDIERHEAMKNSPFHLIEAAGLPATVLLVDDVWTTGATMTAAKKVLESDGKTRALGLTLARG